MTLRKNVASQKLVFTLINATTGAALTGATVTAKISLDGGSSTTATGAVTELANGQYLWSPDQADTNCNVLGVQFTATNAIPRSFTIYTAGGSVGNPVPVDTTHFGGTAGTFASGRPEVNLNGDLTATMKTSVTTAATAATPTVTAGTVSDKTGYALSSGGVQAIWDAATSALTTVGSIGKWILDKLDVVVSTRASQTSVDDLPTNAELATALAAADDAVLAAIAALNNLSAAQVNAEVVDVLAVDALAEPTTVPAHNAALATKLAFLFQATVNKRTLNKDTGVSTQYQSNDSSVVGTGTDSDDGTTFTRGKVS